MGIKNKVLFALTSVALLSVAGCGNMQEDSDVVYKKGVENMQTAKSSDDSEVYSENYAKYSKDLLVYASTLKYSSSQDDVDKVIAEIEKYASEHIIDEIYVSMFTKNVVNKSVSEEFLKELPTKSHKQLVAEYYTAYMVLMQHEPDLDFNELSDKFDTSEGKIAHRYMAFVKLALINKTNLTYDVRFEDAYNAEVKEFAESTKEFVISHNSDIENKSSQKD